MGSDFKGNLSLESVADAGGSCRSSAVGVEVGFYFFDFRSHEIRWANMIDLIENKDDFLKKFAKKNDFERYLTLVSL